MTSAELTTKNTVLCNITVSKKASKDIAETSVDKHNLKYLNQNMNMISLLVIFLK